MKFAIKDFLTFCATTVFTSEVFLIKKDYWTVAHSASLYICQQIYHSIVKNGRVFQLTAVKTNLSNIIIPIISERFHQAMLQGFESLPLKSPTLRFLFTDSTLNCDISSLNIK